MQSSSRQPSRIELASGGLAVVVESAEPLATVERTALDLIRRLHSEQIGRHGSDGSETSTASGFHAERPWMPQTQMPAELDLPNRLNTRSPEDGLIRLSRPTP